MSKAIPRVMIDSGAFSAHTQGAPIELDNWIAFVKKYSKRYPDLEYVNLDVIDLKNDPGEESYNNWERMRGEGLNPLPIFHINSDTKWLHKYLKKTDYIGLGAIVAIGSATKKRTILDRLWRQHLTDGAGWPVAKIHGMGMTSFPLMRRYPWFSLDSTSYLQVSAFGELLVPHRRNGVWDYNPIPHKISVSFQSPDIKLRGQHLNNLTPGLRKLVLQWIDDCGGCLGTSKFEGRNEIVQKPGVCNSSGERLYMNGLLFSRFIDTLEWPRRFTVAPQTTLDSYERLRQVDVAAHHNLSDVPTTTRMFYSGDHAPNMEHFMLKYPDQFDNCGIMLTYFDMQKPNGRGKRRLKSIMKGTA